MKLSEAIIATTRPQYYGEWTGRVGVRMGTCVLAGAFEAARLIPFHWMLLGLLLPVANFTKAGIQARCIWPVLGILHTCPAGCGMNRSVASLCVHLNDDHKWPRQRISQWVALCERAIESPKTIPLSREDAEMWRELANTKEAEDDTEVASVPSH